MPKTTHPYCQPPNPRAAQGLTPPDSEAGGRPRREASTPFRARPGTPSSLGRSLEGQTSPRPARHPGARLPFPPCRRGWPLAVSPRYRAEVGRGEQAWRPGGGRAPPAVAMAAGPPPPGAGRDTGGAGHGGSGTRSPPWRPPSPPLPGRRVRGARRTSESSPNQSQRQGRWREPHPF